ncbi:MBL fold metallo-hydrolase [Dolichospermum flos-aquae]|uniref:MBL fold metallo-hydrolase n=1 Tax=Dolichospermum flos-aquae CCAP 1403/13F TaxID=315271 RepID=A0A6H2C5G1_DOLFA|nr:MBL fold metallo-hydrolase [Dolichospermum flos-aquae]QJB46199.1 MBL fold metallo-hydrolase [Dolichospermum flos-aquae CCAP 1403/13F]
MSDEKFYLKQNVVLEPLVNQWHAWSYLIAPATAAMYILNSHLKIMQSFVSAPKVHISALKSPKMMAGPFVNHDESAASDIKDLIEYLRTKQAHMLELAEAIKILNEYLETEASGFSLEEIYAKIPQSLQGFVELNYDLNNHPAMRLMEGLLYHSVYCNQVSQSIAMYVVEQDQRPFIFSTPRLKQADNLHLHIPFKHQILDQLSKMKYVPGDLQEIKEKLDIDDQDETLFVSFFTQEPPHQQPRQFDQDGVRVRYFGHACLLIESKDVNILCDPLISYNYPNASDRYTYADLPPIIDYIVITHHHHDHCVIETLLQLRHRVKTVIVPKNNGGSLADPAMKLILQSIGFKDVREIDEMEEIDITGGSITGLPFLGEHGDLNIRSKIAYLITLLGRSVMVSADSRIRDPHVCKNICNSVNKIDALFLGLQSDGAPLSWAYGSLLCKPLSRKMDNDRQVGGANFEIASSMVEQLKPNSMYVYAMGYEPWLSYMMVPDFDGPMAESKKLIDECNSKGIFSEQLFGYKEILCRLNK